MAFDIVNRKNFNALDPELNEPNNKPWILQMDSTPGFKKTIG